MKLLITYCTLLLSVSFCYSQKKNILVTGSIANYANQPLRLYQCYGDTLLLADSTITNNNGEFAFHSPSLTEGEWVGLRLGMYKVMFPQSQSFYLLYYGHPVEIKTLYQPNAFYNIATDSLVVLKSDENKIFYQFQHLQQQINVANNWLLQMMRLYPLPDPFHKQIEDEYLKRYIAMDEFAKSTKNETARKIRNSKNDGQIINGLSDLVTLAYYQPVNPDWKQPDPWRDSVIAKHFFDYFNPADSFYLHTNILPEKMDGYIALKTDKRDAYGQPVHDEMITAMAAQQFLDKVKDNQDNLEFCLNYLLKEFNKEKMYDALFSVYDKWVYQGTAGDCEQTNSSLNKWRDKISVLRNIQIGRIAPDFEIGSNLKLSSIESDFTLLLFWASWCPHCVAEVPEIKKTADEFNLKHQTSNTKLITIAVSLDTNNVQWQKFVADNHLSSFLNFSELKGWKSDVVKKYNVYATPTMFLLDKDKKIIAKPETEEQLISALSTIETKIK